MLPKASIRWKPLGESGAINCATHEPKLLANILPATGMESYSTQIFPSSEENPFPITVINVPLVPVCGVISIDGMIVNGADRTGVPVGLSTSTL